MRQGITLIEALFVLGIMAILIGIIMIFLSQSTERSKENELKQEVIMISDMIEQIGVNDPTAIGTDQITGLGKSGLLPSKYISSTNGLVSPWGVSMQVFVGPLNGIMTYAININSLNKKACNAMSSIDFGNSFYRRVIKGTNYAGATLAPAMYAQACNTDSNFYGLVFIM